MAQVPLGDGRWVWQYSLAVLWDGVHSMECSWAHLMLSCLGVLWHGAYSEYIAQRWGQVLDSVEEQGLWDITEKNMAPNIK